MLIKITEEESGSKQEHTETESMITEKQKQKLTPWRRTRNAVRNIR